MKVIIIFLMLVISADVLSDMFSSSHYCTKPYKPYQFNSQSEIDSFNWDVERYRDCISDFVEEQNSAATMHSQSASNAIDEWNNYVNYELN